MNALSFNINSTAIESVELLVNSEVSITWNGGRSYTYSVEDQKLFSEQLQNVIDNDESVGRFINQSIRNNTLQQLVVQ